MKWICEGTLDEKYVIEEVGGEKIPPECHPCFEETEEGRKAILVKVDELPSQAEIEEHMLTHVPFRSWCKFCVLGKSVSNPHRKVDKTTETVLDCLRICDQYLENSTESETPKGG